MGLVLEQQLHIAGDARGELRGALVGRIEREHFQRVYSGQRGAHRLGRTAQHVHVGVVGGDVPARCHGVGEHFAGATARVGVYDVGPQHTSGTELGHLHEVIGADRHREADGPGSLFGAQPCFRQFYEVFVSCREREGQLLRNGRTAVLERFARDGHEFRLGPRLGPPDEPGDGLVTLLSVVAVAEGARERKLPDERVEAEKYTEFLRVRLFGFGHRQHLVGQFGVRFSAESQFGGVQVDAGHEVGDLLRGELFRQVETDGVGTRFHRM